MTNLVSVPGRNISSSQCGMGLNIENPRIRYRPSSAFTWMSLITSGVKILLCPRTALPPSSIVLTLWFRLSEDQLAFGGLQVVVVPELAPADELAEHAGRLDPVDAQLPGQELIVAGGQLRLDAVHAERSDLAADVDRAVIHRVAQAAAHVAADDLPATLQHEPGHRARVAADDDRAALLVDAGAGTDVAADHDIAAAQRRAGQRAGVLVDDDHARHHVLGHRPADPPPHVDLRPVDEPAAEVAEAAVDGDPAAGQDAHGEGVFRARVEDGHVPDALVVDEPAELQVDLPGGQLGRVEHRRGPVRAALHRRGPRRLGVGLGQAAGVIADLHLFHTSTSRS